MILSAENDHYSLPWRINTYFTQAHQLSAIKYEPSTINLVLGTAYKFTVTLTGYSADYSSKLTWMLDSTALTPETVSIQAELDLSINVSVLVLSKLML